MPIKNRGTEAGKKRQAEYARAHYEKNRDKVRARTKILNAKNKERVRECRLAAYKRNPKPILERNRLARKSKKHIIWFRHYRIRYFKNNPSAKIASALRGRVRTALMAVGLSKSETTQSLIGCPWSDLKIKLEGLFSDGMTWDNYGYRGWHIDHIRPCASFDLTDKNQLAECFHYSNLQPLWANDNFRKGSRR
jgi:hypothetical protein